MSDDQAKIEQQRQMILDASKKGTGPKIWAYTKLSGPGWLQSAITLGGGSLSGSLYLGILAGFSLMWLQPLAMVMGVIMLSAIGYVALSTKERPFVAVRNHVNPALGWGWAIATMMANLVWCMPQFALGSAALQQNLAADYFSGVESIGGLSLENSRDIITVIMLFVPAVTVVWFYNSGGWGIRLFEIILKIMVGVVVLSFFGVVFKMATSQVGLAWGEILGGFIPNPSVLFKPSAVFSDALSRAGDADHWRAIIMKDQRDVMITAAATAVGINMTFLLPYSMLQRGWDKDFRGLAMFDLGTGLFIPFMMATSCVVIASASQFHGQPAPGLLSEVDANGNAVTATAAMKGGSISSLPVVRMLLPSRLPMVIANWLPCWSNGMRLICRNRWSRSLRGQQINLRQSHQMRKRKLPSPLNPNRLDIIYSGLVSWGWLFPPSSFSC